MSIQTIEHLWYPQKAVSEIHRVLKVSGLFIGSIPASCKHEMPPQAEASDIYLFEDCKKSLLLSLKKSLGSIIAYKQMPFNPQARRF